MEALRCARAGTSELPGDSPECSFHPESGARASDKVALGWIAKPAWRRGSRTFGNAAGRYQGERPGSPLPHARLACSTRCAHAGRYDGMLGVVTAIECVDFLNKKNKRLPFAIEVIGFGDEEGVRLRSRLTARQPALAGIFDERALEARSEGKSHAGRATRVRARSAARIPEVARQEGRGATRTLSCTSSRGRCSSRGACRSVVVIAIQPLSRLRAIALRGAAGHVLGTCRCVLAATALAALRMRLATERIVKGMRARRHGRGASRRKPGDQRHSVEALHDSIVRAPQEPLRKHAVAASALKSSECRNRTYWICENRNVAGIRRHGVRASPHEQMDACGVEAPGLASPPLHLRRRARRHGARNHHRNLHALPCATRGGISHSPLEAISEAEPPPAPECCLDFIEHFRLPA